MTRKLSWKGRSVTPFPVYLMQLSCYINTVIGSPPRRSPGPEISVQFRRIQTQHQDCISAIRRTLFLCLCGCKWQWVGISRGHPFLCRGVGSILWERVRTGSSFQFLQGLVSWWMIFLPPLLVCVGKLRMRGSDSNLITWLMGLWTGLCYPRRSFPCRWDWRDEQTSGSDKIGTPGQAWIGSR